MTTKHTPGPWIGMDKNGNFDGDHDWCAEDESRETSEVAPIWANGKVVALVVHSQDGYYPGSHPSIEANARLIAAAPDLLEALHEMVDLVGMAIPFDGPQQRKARKAIARATGDAE